MDEPLQLVAQSAREEALDVAEPLSFEETRTMLEAIGA